MKQKKCLEVMKRPLVVFFIVVLLVAIAFLWYEYRPSVIRARCSVEAEKRAENDEYVYEVVYRHCLRSHGIEYSEGKE